MLASICTFNLLITYQHTIIHPSFIYPLAHLFCFLHIGLSTYSFIHSSIHPAILLSIQPSTHLFLSIHPPSIHSSIIHSSIYPASHPPIYTATYPFVLIHHPLIHPSIHSYSPVNAYIHSSTHTFTILPLVHSLTSPPIHQASLVCWHMLNMF